jgi:hypothetical protein
MSGTITTGNIPKALWPGMHAFWGMYYNKHPKEWPEIFTEEKSSKRYEEDTEVSSFGLAQVKPEGDSVSYDSHEQQYTTKYTHVVYGLGFIVTKEEIEDNLYMKVGKNRTQALSFSMRQTEENVCANILNRAFNSAYVGGDGKEMIAIDHPTVNGTQSNELATAADLSEASLENLAIQIMQAQNTRGLKISIKPRKLIVAPGNAFTAQRILKSELQTGTGNNDINAIRSMGLFPDGYCVNHYLTDADAFFIKTDCPNGLTRFTRRGTDFTRDNDFDTTNMKAKSTMRFSAGWSDWRGVFGTPGV